MGTQKNGREKVPANDRESHYHGNRRATDLASKRQGASDGMCLLFVLERSKVEIAVLLNELAYLKYEAPKDTSATSEAILSKQRNVAIAYSLVEKIIKLISNIGENDGIYMKYNLLRFYILFFLPYQRKKNNSIGILGLCTYVNLG